MLMLVANLLALGMLVLPDGLRTPRLRLPAALAMVCAFAQMAVEGPRWQMVPAYGLTLLIFVVSMARARSVGVAGAVAGRGWRAFTAIGLGAAAFVMAAALPVIAPVFSFPATTGAYAIGTLTYHWIDAARSEAFATNPQARRELMVQIWYPAHARASGLRSAYMPDAGAMAEAFARIHHLPQFVFGHFRYVRTHATPSLPAASDPASFPVLLFLEGATGFRQMNTYQIENLVSHGYIVVAIDQPGAAASVVFPDGHQIEGLDLAQFQATVRPSYMPDLPGLPGDITPIPPGLTRQSGSFIAYLARDVAFTLDQLADLNRADPNGILTSKLNLQHVGAFGISLGGIVVGEACLGEPRIRACLVMDAAMSTDVVQAGLNRPSMWITRDAATMRLERKRAGGWPEAEIEAHQTSMRAAFEGLSGAGYFVRVPGMFHSNFTDISIWTPISSLLGFAGPIDPQRAHAIVNAYTLAFFDRHLSGHKVELLEGPSTQYPEADFEARVP